MIPKRLRISVTEDKAGKKPENTFLLFMNSTTKNIPISTLVSPGERIESICRMESIIHNYKYIFMFINIKLPKQIFKITNGCLSFWSSNGWTLL